MRIPLLLLIGMILCVLCRATPARASIDPPPAERAEILRRYGLDPATPLESRVRETPDSVLKMFEESKLPKPTAHPLTAEERRKLSAAFAALPPLHRRILSERLRSVSFLDGMPNTALTSPANPNDPYRLFDITIRAGILNQTASEWLTEKERSVFDTKDPALSVSIEAGKRDALVFVLLHEATHIVDFCLELTPAIRSGEQKEANLSPTPFTQGIWSDRLTPAPPFRDPLRQRIRFYTGGAPIAMDQAEAVYESLRRTPFVSLYGGSNWHDDLAEYVAVYHWTTVLKQPYRIVLSKGGNPVFSYEPMKSVLVRSRIGLMQPFYEKASPDRK